MVTLNCKFEFNKFLSILPANNINYRTEIQYHQRDLFLITDATVNFEKTRYEL